jgi:hypothetical protein
VADHDPDGIRAAYREERPRQLRESLGAEARDALPRRQIEREVRRVAQTDEQHERRRGDVDRARLPRPQPGDDPEVAGVAEHRERGDRPGVLEHVLDEARRAPHRVREVLAVQQDPLGERHPHHGTERDAERDMPRRDQRPPRRYVMCEERDGRECDDARRRADEARRMRRACERGEDPDRDRSPHARLAQHREHPERGADGEHQRHRAVQETPAKQPDGAAVRDGAAIDERHHTDDQRDRLRRDPHREHRRAGGGRDVDDHADDHHRLRQLVLEPERERDVTGHDVRQLRIELERRITGADDVVPHRHVEPR